MSKLKRRKQKTGKYTSAIPKSAKPVRFFIILSIALVLFFAFLFLVMSRGAWIPQ